MIMLHHSLSAVFHRLFSSPKAHAEQQQHREMWAEQSKDQMLRNARIEFSSGDKEDERQREDLWERETAALC